MDAIINGTASSNNTSITNWTSFFRPEQAQVSLSINASQIKHYSAAPPSDFHLKYTPWGTQRLFINDETIDDNGVRNIYSALTGLNATTGSVSASPNIYEINGMALRNIFNLNSLAGNKTTLNAGYGKAQSLSGVVSSTING
ncbi:MAG: hypothetical protein EBS96_11795, partial [Spartobacteria bacterium]|nr:hypothetical protein [Spartobacteria bacterium]